MLVDRVEPVEHRAKVLRTDRDHGRKPDRRVHRVASAHPVPEAEHVLRVDAELGHLGGVGRDRDEMFCDRLLVAERLEAPLTRALRVGHGLERGESLRRDDEQRLGRIEVARRFDEVGAVDVGDEAHGEIAIAVVAQRLVGHHRPQVRAADSDVDDVADALAGVALPRAVAHAAAERRHPVEHLVNLGHHVLAVGHDRRAARRAQGHVQNGAPLGDVDLLAREHRVDAPAQSRFLGQREQQAHRVVGDAMLGVVEVESRGLGREGLAAPRVLAEQRAQMNVADFLVMLAQRLPGAPFGERRRFGLHRSSPFA